MFRHWPLVTALFITLLNAAKPVCVDDAYYLRLAREIARHPSEPYGPPPTGFETIWSERPQGAFTILAPPVLPYYLALGITVFGDDPVLLKLWLFPLVLLFTRSIVSFARRFVPERSREVLFLVSLSAASLPCWNLMLDLPAVALGLAGVTGYANGLDTRRWWSFASAGIMLGLAFETKYNAIGFMALVASWGLVVGELRRTVLCLALALVVVLGWEGFVAAVYGESHFLYHSFRRIGSTIAEKRSHLILPLIGTFGAVAPYLWLFPIQTRRTGQWLLAILAMVLSFVFLLPEERQQLVVDEKGSPRVSLAGVVFVTLGILNLLALGWAMTRRPNKILVIWMVFEFGVAFWLSPFCAARRVIGVVIASTILFSSIRKDSAKLLVSFTVIWGMLLFSVDALDATVEPDAVRAIAGDYPSETVWFRGHWGFADAGERAGWRIVYPGESRLEAGDLLVYPDLTDRLAGQPISIPDGAVEVLEVRHFWSLVPIRTIPDWYGGKIPLRHHDSPSLTVTIFRVREAFLVPPPGKAVSTSPTRRKKKP